MRKISTLFKKNINNLSVVINEIDPDNAWVLDGNCIATRKFDGSAVAIINGELYKRYDVKCGKKVPDGAIPCQNPDATTGHWPHWVKCDRNNNADKWHFIAYDAMDSKIDGTYELCGEKIQGNPENIFGHRLIKHGSVVCHISDLSFEGIKKYLSSVDIEGIVFHNHDGRMCKIRKSDFGITR